MDKFLYYLGIKNPPWGIRAIVYDKGVKILKKKNYRNISKIGSGGYGDVVKLSGPGWRKNRMAAKIISSFVRSPGEAELWKKFKHPNVLPLLDIIQEPEVDIYFMPLLKTSLDKILVEDSFRLDANAFEITKTWMREVSQGLRHLHNMNVAHLDLKIDNVLIDSKMRAVIADFSCTAVMDKKIESYGLTKFFRPPEVCSSLGKMIAVNGREFDMWSYGILAHYTWTRVMPSEGNEVHEYWKKVAYPAIFDSLKVSTFRNLLQENFPKAVIGDKDVIYALNILKGILRYDSGKRPLVSEILQHPSITDYQYGANLLEVDDIWTWKTDLTDDNALDKSNMESTTSDASEKGDIPDSIVVSCEDMRSTTNLEKIRCTESKMATATSIVEDNHEYSCNLNSDVNENSKEYMFLVNGDKEVFIADCEEEDKNSSQQKLLFLKIEENNVSDDVIQVTNIEENMYNITSENMKEFNDEVNKAKEEKNLPDLPAEGKVILEDIEDDKVVHPSPKREDDKVVHPSPKREDHKVVHPSLHEVNTDPETLDDDHLRRQSEKQFEGNQQKKRKVVIFSKAWFMKKFRIFRKS